MIRTVLAAALLAVVLTGCTPAATGHPSTVPPSSTASQQDACRSALRAVYAQARAGNQSTGDLPTPAACAGLDQGTYLRLAMEAMSSPSPN